MYNPYNWKIEKKNKDVEMKMPVYPGCFTNNCVLDELTIIFNKLDGLKLQRIEKEKELNEINTQLWFLEERKKMLLEKLFDGEDCI